MSAAAGMSRTPATAGENQIRAWVPVLLKAITATKTTTDTTTGALLNNRRTGTLSRKTGVITITEKSAMQGHTTGTLTTATSMLTTAGAMTGTCLHNATIQGTHQNGFTANNADEMTNTKPWPSCRGFLVKNAAAHLLQTR